MSSILCPNSSLCDYPPPFTNLSSEAPDDLDYFGFYWGPPQLKPPLGSTWSSWSCLGTCTSTVSQADADLCAANENLQCLFNPPGAPPVVKPPPPGTGIDYTLFWNDTLVVTVNCPDGNPFTYLFAGGQILGTSQFSANQKAIPIAKDQARSHIICLSDLTSLGCRSDGTVQIFLTASGFYVDPGVLGAGTNQWQIISGGLPTGLTLQGYPNGPVISPLGFAGPTLILSGTPTAPGIYMFTLSITLRSGDNMKKTYVIEVLPKTSPGTAISQPLVQPACGVGKNAKPAIASGSLPTGTSVSQAGPQDILTGTPTEAATCVFVLSY